MATEDIRVLLSFKGHRKRKRLKLKLGPGYLDNLIDLWITAASDRPDGNLKDWDEIDIADAAGWEKDPFELVNALVDCKWLDRTENGYKIHNWEKRQGWCLGSEDRSKKAKINAMIRHYGRELAFKKLKKIGIDPAEFGYTIKKKDPADSNADSKNLTNSNAASIKNNATQQCDQHATRNAPSPSPSPSKNPSAIINPFPFVPDDLFDRIIQRFPGSFAFLRKAVLYKKNEKAILSTLQQIDKVKIVESFPGLFLKIISRENGNFNESDFQEQERQKRLEMLKQQKEQILNDNKTDQ